MDFDYAQLSDLGLPEVREEILHGDRQKFWQKNKDNVSKNVKYLVDKIGTPKGWKTYVIIGEFVSNREIRPGDYDAWCVTLPVCAARKQGHEILLYINKVGAFKSLPAYLPLVSHELVHVEQIARDIEQYLKSLIDDDVCSILEQEADAERKKIDRAFEKQNIAENIIYCHDMWGFPDAERMARYFYKERADMYSGGYQNLLDSEEFALFKKAEDKNDIMFFIERYI